MIWRHGDFVIWWVDVRILEVGTGSGTRTLALARNMPAAGSIISMEAAPPVAAAARQHFASAGYGDRINVIVGDPARFLHKLRGPFDMIVHSGSFGLSDRLRPLLTARGVLIESIDDTIGEAPMTIAEWLAQAKADAEQRGMPELIPMLEGLAQATERLRAADWNDVADKDTPHDDHQ